MVIREEVTVKRKSLFFEEKRKVSSRSFLASGVNPSLNPPTTMSYITSDAMSVYRNGTIVGHYFIVIDRLDSPICHHVQNRL